MLNIDPYTISLAVAQFVPPPLFIDHKHVVRKELKKKIEKEKRTVNPSTKGRFLDTYA